MNAKERCLDALEFFKAGQNVSAESVFNLFIEAVKEEIIPKDQTYQEFFGLEEDKIQGYTAEQWQEIIDGGYLCEFGEGGNISYAPLIKIRESDWVFYGIAGIGIFSHACRPAQIKGVMRPIFVEPVGKDAYVIMFDHEDSALHSGNRVRYSSLDDLPNIKARATKYIEV